MASFLYLYIGVLGQDIPPDQLSYESVKKGRTLVGTYFNFSLSNTSKNRVNQVDTKSSQSTLGGNITLGKMVSDHSGLLLNVGYEETNSVTPFIIGGVAYDAKEKRIDYTIAGGYRYYKLISEGTYFFIQGGIKFSVGNQDTDELDRNNNKVTYSFKTKGFGVGISPGFSYFMTDKLSTEISIGLLGYAVYDGQDGYGNQTHTTVFQSLLYLNSVSLGFVYYL